MVIDEKITNEEKIEEKTEEKIIGRNGENVEEKMTEESMESIDREDVIDNYIEHIRNISELTDDEIASVIDDTIEEDEELLEILEKFLSRRQNIREKIISIKTDIDEKEEEDKDERREEIDDILETFDDPDYAYPLEDIMRYLRESGYADPGPVIIDAMNDGILYVDSIEDHETLYIALTKEGDALWELRNQ